MSDKQGTEVVDWKAQLAERAQDVAASERPAISVLSLAAGIMTYMDQEVPNNTLSVVVLHAGAERMWYNRPWDADDKGPPDCYAQSESHNDAGMVPAENVDSPPASLCTDCPNSQWGSAETGKGQACKLRRKLIVAPASCIQSPESVEKAELLLINVPPTSGKFYSNYANKIASIHSLPPFAVVTSVSYKADKRTLYRMDFDYEDSIESNDVIGALIKRVDQVKPLVLQPYDMSAGSKPKEEAKPVKGQRTRKK